MAVEFSLVIPTHNRGPALALTLERLRALRYPRHGFEVVVVDDGSTDDTSQVLDAYQDHLPMHIFRQPQAGAAAARNRGIREAQGLRCLFVDDDVLVCPDLLLEHHESHLGRFNLLVRGPVINFSTMPAPKEPPPLWKHYSMNYLCTSNASLNRESLLHAGLFDETFDRWEDAELGVRLKRLGIQRVFNLRAYVFHWKPQPSAEQRLETARRDGRSAAQLYRRYPSLRMWLRSGLHPLNTVRNSLLRALPLRANWRKELDVEAAYLESGLREMNAAVPPAGGTSRQGGPS